MDFLDFDGSNLYFDCNTSTKVEELILQAASAYPNEEAEWSLLKAYLHEPENLSVHVALYRYYYYKHDYPSAFKVAEQTLTTSGKLLGIIGPWNEVDKTKIANGVLVSMGLVRYYLLGLKASAYLLMRMNSLEQAIKRLEKVRELDPEDQFGVQELLVIAKRRLSDIEMESYESEQVKVLNHYR